MNKDQINFDESQTQRLWNSTIDRVKSEADSDSDDEPRETTHQ